MKKRIDMAYNNDPRKPLILSASSANTFNSCERKGLEYSIKKSKPDSDYIRPGYFAFGTAFHSVLEKSMHDFRRFKTSILFDACKSEWLFWNNEGAKLMAILRSYWALIAESNLKPTHFEKWFQNDLARGKIDLILEAPSGWYICDTKTNGQSLSPTKKTELTNDPQMNLYGAFHDIIAESLDLDPDKWLGIVYREVEKPKQHYKLGETFEEFHARIAEKGNPKAREIIVSRDELNWDNSYANFLKTLTRAREIQTEYLNGLPDSSRQDFNSCKKFGTPCEYWSKCYNCLYSSTQSEKTLDILSIL